MTTSPRSPASSVRRLRGADLGFARGPHGLLDPLPAPADRGAHRSARPPFLRAALLAALLGAACAGALLSRVWPEATAAFLGQGAAAARALGLTGWPAAFAAQLVIALCGVLPASVGAVTAGVAFGVAGGFALSGSATLLAAAVGFLLGRSLARPLLAGAIARHPGLRRLDSAAARDGWRLVALLRVSPVMPFAVTSYALGLTSLGLRDYLVGTLAALPALLGYVALGALTSTGAAALSAGGGPSLQLGLLALAIAATGLLVLRLARLARAVLRLPDAPSLT